MAPRSWCDARTGEVIVRLRVQPRAASAAVVGVVGERLRVRVPEAPTAGRANAAVVALIARLAGVPKSAVRISHGGASREKTLRIEATEPRTVADRLWTAIGACANGQTDLT